jgi:hypothetical protein
LPEVRSGKIEFEEIGSNTPTATIRPCALVAEFFSTDSAEVLEAFAFFVLAVRAITARRRFAIVTEGVARPESLVALGTASRH